MNRPAVLIASVVCVLAGCPETKDNERAAPSTSESGAAGPKVQPSATAATDVAKEADAILASWLAAQNEGKLDAYTALYDKDFKGVRRTGDGTEKTFDRDGWSKDRARLFQKKQEVAAEGVKKSVAGDTVTLTFMQRWRSGKSADHGEKVLELRLSKDDNKVRIVREDLKWSERGWEDSRDMVFNAADLVAPITMTVEKVRKPDNGDCSASSLRISFEDSKGSKKELEYGTITGMGGDATGKGGRLAPKNDEYTDLGVYCAGLQQGYTVKVAGDKLMALAIWQDEESGPGKDNKVIARLPAGAKIIMK